MTDQTKAILTPGRWRGLRATSIENVFTILAFDQRGTYRRLLPEGVSYQTATQIKHEIAVPLSRYASAVLLDPEYGLAPALHLSRQSGLLFALEKSGYSGDANYRRPEFIDSWTVAKIRNSGADAAKLLLYYHPDSGELAEEIEALAGKIIAECHQHDLPVFIEPVSYSLDKTVAKDSEKFARTKPRVVLETARRFSALKPDVLKLEFPVDPAFNQNRSDWREACEAIGADCSVPWVLLSAGVNFEIFERQTILACQSGASGFLAGRAIWKEAVALPAEERRQFVTTIATERIKRLSDIAASYARAWQDFYDPIPQVENWYSEYLAN